MPMAEHPTARALRARVGADADLLTGLARRIHGHPEVGFEEHHASRWTAEPLADAGFTVRPGVADLPTAFAARAGSGSVHIGLFAEYDALPGIGHACGHNIIAASAVGAARALARVADDLDLTVHVFGTPADEGGGGKILMREHGVFTGLAAAAMVHPAPVDAASFACLALAHLRVRYRGRASHAAAGGGANALDAITVANTAIGLLRGNLAATDKVHGVVNDGGVLPNIVPRETTATYFVRAATPDDLAALERRVRACLEAGALATGTEVEITEGCPPYAHFRHDAELGALYRRSAATLGRTVAATSTVTASTDLANVSWDCPTLHAMIAIPGHRAVNHTEEFTAAAGSPEAAATVTDGATALALTVADYVAGRP